MKKLTAERDDNISRSTLSQDIAKKQGTYDSEESAKDRFNANYKRMVELDKTPEVNQYIEETKTDIPLNILKKKRAKSPSVMEYITITDKMREDQSTVRAAELRDDMFMNKNLETK